MSVLIPRPRLARNPNRYVKQRTLVRLVMGRGGFIGELSLTEVFPALERYRNGNRLVMLTEFYVHPLRRRRGWGKELLDNMVRLVDKKGWDVLTYARSYGIGRKPKDEELVQLYRRYGFRSAGRDDTYLVRRCR
jgi:GNAT superfamily N-acetyltransferase